MTDYTDFWIHLCVAIILVLYGIFQCQISDEDRCLLNWSGYVFSSVIVWQLACTCITNSKKQKKTVQNTCNLLSFHMFPNNVHDDWSSKVCRVFLKSADIAFLGKVLKGLHGFRCCAVDIWRQGVDKCIVNPFPPFSLFPVQTATLLSSINPSNWFINP